MADAGVLVVLIGAPGSGKSTLARSVAKALAADLIQTDLVRKQLFAEPRYTGGESGAVYGWCYNLIQSGLATGRRMVFDATNLEERGRRRLYATAEAHRARFLLVWVCAPPHVIQERMLRRRDAPDEDDYSDADWAVYLQLSGRVEPVRRPHLAVNTTTDLSALVRRIVAAVARPGGAVENRE